MARAKRSPPKKGRRPGQGRRGAKWTFPVVGIGASAGGLDAIERVLKNLPADTGMAFLVAQHLDPKHESALSSILSRCTSMPVAEARDRMRIDADHVYIIPPNSNMFVRDTSLGLEPRQFPHSRHMPVDSLFRSMAAAHRNMAIGVILSGTASDGAAGMRAIKTEGGITFAQDANSAKYFGMPDASISTGAVDFVLPPEEIAKALARIGRHPYLKPFEIDAERASLSAKDQALAQLFQLLKKTFRVDFSAYKPSTIGRRIRRRMAVRGIDQTADYVRFVRENPDELKVLYQDMFIGVTEFFREPEAFEALKKQILPRLLKERETDTPIRVWVPGCSTGEEVYSIAIALLEFLKNRNPKLTIQVFGTDVDEKAITWARTGRYLEHIAAAVGKARLRRFFVRVDDGYRVNQAVRDVCVFAKHDILIDPPFSRLDLLSCRNVLIYMDTAAQTKLLPIFHYALRPAGFLMLGTAETVGGFSDLFTLVQRRYKIYAKRDTTRPRLEWLPDRPAAPESPNRPGSEPVQRSDFELQKGAADLIILNEYAPAAVLVNEDMEILHVRGHTGAYLEPSPGVASLNLMKMAREGLLVGLRTAMESVRRKNAPVLVDGLRVQSDGKEKSLDLSVVPVRPPDTKNRTFLVMFRESSPRADTAAASRHKLSSNPAFEQRSAQLRQELTATKAYLQSVIENQDASNEELRSLNEELLSTNEELQSTTEELETSNEELQSANEELITLNEELQRRNDDLAQAHSDILNLLSSLSLSVIMVDPELRIRRLTPTAQMEMNLLSSDVGRPLSNVRLSVEVPELEAVVRRVMEKKTPSVNLELVGLDGRWRLFRVTPYRTPENEIIGAVLSLTDIHEAKLSEDRFRTLVEAAPDAMVICDYDGRIRLVNAQTEHLFGFPRAELMGKPVEKLMHEVESADRVSYFREPKQRLMGSGLHLKGMHKQGKEFPVEVSISPIRTSEGTFSSATIRDVSDRRKREQQARRFAVLAERGLARDVHDNLAQGLAGIVVHLEGASEILKESPEEAMRQIVSARDLARSSLAQARRSLLALRPEILEETDLPGALERITGDMAHGTAIKARFTLHGTHRSLAVEIEENLLRIAQEAVANGVKHGTPKHLTVELVYEPESVRLRIVDDGKGYTALDRGRGSGLGLAIMKGRAASIGGILEIESRPGQGTTVEAVVPAGGGGWVVDGDD